MAKQHERANADKTIDDGNVSELPIDREDVASLRIQ